MPKFFLIQITIFFIFSCEKSSIIEIPNNVIFSNNINLSIDGKFLLYKNKRFSGYLEEINTNNIITSRIGYHNGRKEGIEKIWYNNNKISELIDIRKKLILQKNYQKRVNWTVGILYEIQVQSLCSEFLLKLVVKN